jgi:hypothetical protein
VSHQLTLTEVVGRPTAAERTTTPGPGVGALHERRSRVPSCSESRRRAHLDPTPHRPRARIDASGEREAWCLGCDARVTVTPDGAEAGHLYGCVFRERFAPGRTTHGH